MVFEGREREGGWETLVFMGFQYGGLHMRKRVKWWFREDN